MFVRAIWKGLRKTGYLLLLAFEYFAKIFTFSGKLLKLEQVGKLLVGLNTLIRFKILHVGLFTTGTAVAQ